MPDLLDDKLNEEMQDPEAIKEIMEALDCGEETAKRVWRRFMNRTIHKMKDAIDPETPED